MVGITIINKFAHLAGWNSISLILHGRVVEGITGISYCDKTDKQNLYGAGGLPVGRGIGNTEANAAITLFKEEVNALLMALEPGKSLKDISPFDITIQYEYNGFIYKDRVRNCEFTSNQVDVKQGDKSITTKYDLICSNIEWNVI